MNIKRFFIYTLIISLLFTSSTPIYSASEKLTGSLKYIVIIDGYDLTNKYNTITIQCIVKMNIVNNRVESIGVTNITTINIWFTPNKKLLIFLLRELFQQWFDTLKLFDKTNGIDKTYLSVNGKIIEANIVPKDNGTEYREINTGLFVGGDQFLLFKITKYGISISFVLSIISYLIEVSPENLLNKLHVVNPPILETRIVTFIFALIIMFLAIYTISRWEYYSIM